MLLPSHKHLHQDCATGETSIIRVGMKDLSDFQTRLHELSTIHTHPVAFFLEIVQGIQFRSAHEYVRFVWKEWTELFVKAQNCFHRGSLCW